MKTLRDLIHHNERTQSYQDSLSYRNQIELLKQHNKSVFTFHMSDGRRLVRGDSESDSNEMREFFKMYPQEGCKYIEFHK